MHGTTESQQAAPPAADVAPAVIVRFPSAVLGSEQVATVLLPPEYSESRTSYPVLYLLHGGGQDHTAFATRSWFAAQRLRGMIIVTPGAGDSWYVNSVADPKARYEDFLVKDLLQYIDTRYRTIASREGRAVAGVSMGAWGAMMLALKHHHLFGAVGALSAVRDFATSSGDGYDLAHTATVRRPLERPSVSNEIPARWPRLLRWNRSRCSTSPVDRRACSCATIARL